MKRENPSGVGCSADGKQRAKSLLEYEEFRFVKSH